MPAEALRIILPVLAAASAALLTIGLIRLLWPFLIRYALARPNARSLHNKPTPQGGGLAVVLATLIVGLLAMAMEGEIGSWWPTLALAGSAAGLAAVGGLDDVRPLPAAPRLVLQLALAGLAISALPADLRIVGPLPFAIERIGLVVALGWFVNLTNFMDGMDLMTVTEIVPISAALAIFAALGVLPVQLGLLMLALCGSLLGFAPLNWPPARLFLGDVGSLPVGLLVGFCLIELAGHGHLAAALLLPLYYLADSGLTLLRRFKRGARVWEAHREHFYQIAAANGLATGMVVGRILALNLLLVALAFVAHFWTGTAVGLSCVMAGILAVAAVLRSLLHHRSGSEEDAFSAGR